MSRPRRRRGRAMQAGPVAAAAACAAVVVTLGSCARAAPPDGGGRSDAPADAPPDAMADVPPADASGDGHGDADDCAPATDVATGGAAGASLPPADWPSLLEPMSLRPITGDLRASAELVLDASAVLPPAECEATIDGCLAAVRYTSALAGVTLEDHAGDGLVFTARAARIAAGASFRLRAYYYSEFPFVEAVIPTVEIVPACVAACTTGQARCPDDRGCYAEGESYCYQCERRARDRCACVAPDGDRPDGELCSFPLSADLLADGTCLAGVCTPSS